MFLEVKLAINHFLGMLWVIYLIMGKQDPIDNCLMIKSLLLLLSLL